MSDFISTSGFVSGHVWVHVDLSWIKDFDDMLHVLNTVNDHIQWINQLPHSKTIHVIYDTSILSWSIVRSVALRIVTDLGSRKSRIKVLKGVTLSYVLCPVEELRDILKVISGLATVSLEVFSDIEEFYRHMDYYEGYDRA